MAKNKRRNSRHVSVEGEEIQPLNREQKRIMAWLRQVRFKRKFFGGVNERDVWKKIEELNQMFNLALVAERARYDALLQQREATHFSNGVDTIFDEREEN